MKKAFFSQGPGVTLTSADVEILNEKGHVDFGFNNINGILRVSLVRGEIPPRDMCERGVSVRRYPESISPYEYKGVQLWVIKISKQRLDDLIASAKRDTAGYDTFMSRCKYDRISLGYLHE